MVEITLGKDTCYDIASDSLGRKSLQISRDVLASNPALTEFDLSRTGDDVTLRFGFGEGIERTDFRLLGSKHDFYRLSMGVRLGETLTNLAKGDPNIEATGAEAAGEVIVLRVAYAWPEGHIPSYALVPEPEPLPERPPAPRPPPVVASTPDDAPETNPEPARNPKYFVPARELVPLDSLAATRKPSDTPLAPSAPVPSPPTPSRAPAGATGAPVAVEAPQAPPLTTATGVRESAATAAPAARESARPAPRNRAEVDYRTASQTGTLKAWTQFLDLHPDSPFSAEAKSKADQLREQAAYALARERDDSASYRGFLKNFPNSSLRGEVEVRIKALEESRRVAELERRNAAAQANRLRATYDQTRKLDSPEAYRVFLAAYPDSEEAVEARKRLQAVEDDDKAYRDSRGSASRLDGYLTLYPEGRHAEEARKELQSIRGLGMEADYRAAAAAGTAKAYRDFLDQWPRSPHASAVHRTLAALDRNGAQNGSNGNGHSLVTSAASLSLSAPAVSTPPEVDGDPVDPAWQAAPPLVVPLRGRTGPEALRVRAVHDGTRVFFLLHWDDTTHDLANRPWNWSPAEKTYRQSSHLDDGAAIMLFGDSVPGDGCMLSGDDWRGDNWVWRANWSDISGLADDGQMRGSKGRLPQSNPYPAADGSGQVWISRQPDAGTPGWSFYIPLGFEGQVVGSYQASTPRGSRTDVAARGAWTPGDDTSTWTVEFSRALDTRHEDDQVLRIGQAAVLAFAVYNRNDNANHSASSLVRLELQEGPR